uniref:Secreted protein n=1 Tax=Macrostomum lignano TaxID=282301 RepID=A0A1I8F3S8_9PLAT
MKMLSCLLYSALVTTSSRSRSRADQLRSPTHRQQPGPDPQTAQSRAAGLEPSLYRRTASASTASSLIRLTLLLLEAAMTATARLWRRAAPQTALRQLRHRRPCRRLPDGRLSACRFSRRPPTDCGRVHSACRPAAAPRRWRLWRRTTPRPSWLRIRRLKLATLGEVCSDSSTGATTRTAAVIVTVRAKTLLPSMATRTSRRCPFGGPAAASSCPRTWSPWPRPTG